MRSLRIRFDKTGSIKYISHLDLMRLFTRAMRRAEIPLWFTEGFNPRPYLQFALPLSLGMQSVCETVDIRTESDMPAEEILERLRKVMPEGINVKSIGEPVYDPKYIMKGEFDLVFTCENREKMINTIRGIMNAPELTVEKPGKQGRKKVMKSFNLLEFIESSLITETENAVVLTVVLPAGSVKNINPFLLSEKIVAACGETVNADVIRKKLMLEDGSEFV